MTYQCEHCRKSFNNFYSLRSHINGSVYKGIPGCARIGGRPIPETEHDDIIAAIADDSVADAVITNPVDIQHEICRRHQDDSILSPPNPLHNLGGEAVIMAYTGSCDYGALVSAFQQYCVWILGSRSHKFWSLFLATRHHAQDDQRQLLELVRNLFKVKQIWCADKRAVRYLLDSKPFWPLATYTYTCDLTGFRVPGLGEVKYTFVDPIFAWILQARKLCKKYELLFRYRESKSKGSGQKTWGSCVSCGEAMRQVVTPGSYPQVVTPGSHPQVVIPGSYPR